MKLRQATLCDPIEPPKVDPAKIDEAVTLTTEVLGEMQTGALSVGDREALGCQGAQTVGHGALQGVIEEELCGWPGGHLPHILHAQTTIEKAREQNLAQQARDSRGLRHST